MQMGLKEFKQQTRATGYKVQGQGASKSRDAGQSSTRPKLSDDEKEEKETYQESLLPMWQL